MKCVTVITVPRNLPYELEESVFHHHKFDFLLLQHKQRYVATYQTNFIYNYLQATIFRNGENLLMIINATLGLMAAVCTDLLYCLHFEMICAVDFLRLSLMKETLRPYNDDLRR